MILIFLGSMRATVAVFFSIPLSALATFLALSLGGGTVNSMVLGGLALALSRLIDNSVVVLENIYRHLELGEKPETAAENGGREVALPVLSATLTTAVVFFPVTFLYGVSQFLFSALALAVVLALFASYAVAMTVVPLFCARFLKASHQHTPSEEVPVMVLQEERRSFGQWFNVALSRSCVSTIAWWEAPCGTPGSRSPSAGFLSPRVWLCSPFSACLFFHVRMRACSSLMSRHPRVRASPSPKARLPKWRR
jgi:multidrug efflux pump subunit AcrB